jgi:hypothetical protein
MPIVIQQYRKEHEPAVEAFNRRLQPAGDPNLVFYKTCIPPWLPPTQDNPLYNEFFLAREGDVVRGGYALKHERVFVRDIGEVSVACYHHALSEGIVDRAYAAVGGLMIRHALSRQPVLYALGMGGYDQPLAKMLRALGWSMSLVPFLFKVVHPSDFLRQMQTLRTTFWRRVLMDAGALTGVGWVSLRAAQTMKQGLRRQTNPANAERVSEFANWADPLWLRERENYTMAAKRDSSTLRTLYDAADRHFTRLRVSRKGIDLGWAVVGERRKDSKYGSMKVGSIVDCWASPENAAAVAELATRELEEQGMDLVLSNQGHKAWGCALQGCGFFRGPSNFVFAASRKYSEILQRAPDTQIKMHITRADGDGLPRNF